MALPSTTLVGLTGDYKGQTAPVSDSAFEIGRSAECGLYFPDDPFLSRRHARVYFEAGSWNIVDLGSSNGIFVNGQRLKSGSKQVLRPGDEFRCGVQTFKLEWVPERQIQAPPVIAPPVISSNSGHARPPIQPVILGQNSQYSPSPVHRIPPPQASIPKKQKREKTYRWVKQGELVEVQGRQITCGLFYFGQWMKMLDSGSYSYHYSVEPSLIDPSLPANYDEPPVAYDNRNYSYNGISAHSRASYLDWLAAGRPAESMTDANGLRFLACIERAHIRNGSIVAAGLVNSVKELKRLVAGAPAGSYAASQMRTLLICLNELELPPAEQPLTPEHLKSLSFKQKHEARLRLYRRAMSGEPFNAVEAMIAVLSQFVHQASPTFHRCPEEVLSLFRLECERRYPKGVTYTPTKNAYSNDYEPVNPKMSYFRVRTAPDVFRFTIETNTLKKLDKMLARACDAAADYGRRIIKKPDDAGKLPAIVLLPQKLVTEHPATKALAQLAEQALNENGKLPLSKVAEIWSGWPQEQSLTKSDKELLVKALWYSGFIMEPRPSITAALKTGSNIFVGRSHGDDLWGDSEHLTKAQPFAAICLYAVAANQTLQPETIDFIHARVCAINDLTIEDATRLKIYMHWLVDSGSPKLTKKLCEAVDPAHRRPLIEFLTELAASDGNVAPAEIKVIEKAAEMFGISDSEIYALLHAAPANQPLKTVKAASGHGLDMDLVTKKVKESRAASAILGSVFVEEEAPPVEPVNDPEPTEIVEGGGGLRAIIKELAASVEWSAADFRSLVMRHGKMPDAAYEELNEAGFEAVNDPLLEGEDPIFVDLSVAQELLK